MDVLAAIPFALVFVLARSSVVIHSSFFLLLSAAANLADLDRLYATVKEQKGHIDILFANAGIGELVPLGAITEAHFDKTFGINVKGLVFTVQKALPLFQDGGSIILNASIAASKGVETASIYNATKAAIRSFARTWTVELKHRKIRVNAISPLGFKFLSVKKSITAFLMFSRTTIPMNLFFIGTWNLIYCKVFIVSNPSFPQNLRAGRYL